MPKMSQARCVFIIVISVFTAFPAVSATYNLFGRSNCGASGFETYSDAGEGVARFERIASNEICTTELDVDFGVGYLASSGFASGLGGGVETTAAQTYEFKLTTPQDYSGGLIDIAVRADASALVSISSTLDYGGVDALEGVFVPRQEAAIRARVAISGTALGRDREGIFTQRAAVALTGGNENVQSEIASINEVIQTPTVRIDPLEPVFVTFSWTGNAASAFIPFASSNLSSEQAADILTSTGMFDAGNTLNFTSSGDVFLLPEGFSVSNPSAGITDNSWVDPRISPVPLPAGFSLLLGALLFLPSFRWLRRGSSI